MRRLLKRGLVVGIDFVELRALAAFLAWAHVVGDQEVPVALSEAQLLGDEGVSRSPCLLRPVTGCPGDEKLLTTGVLHPCDQNGAAEM